MGKLGLKKNPTLIYKRTKINKQSGVRLTAFHRGVCSINLHHNITVKVIQEVTRVKINSFRVLVQIYHSLLHQQPARTC